MARVHGHAWDQRLAMFRELPPAEQERIREHAAGCRRCGERLRAFDGQDRALMGLAEVISKGTWAGVLARLPSPAVTTGRLPAPWLHRAWAIAAVVFALLGTGTAAVAASAGALPGELLYPLKRQVEATRGRLTASEPARQRLEAEYAERRRAEAGALQAMGQFAEMRIEGLAEPVQGDVWAVSGLHVTVDPSLWPGPTPSASGARVRMQVAVGPQGVDAIEVTRGAEPAPTAPPAGRTAAPGSGLPPETPERPAAPSPTTPRQPGPTGVPSPQATPPAEPTGQADGHGPGAGQTAAPAATAQPLPPATAQPPVTPPGPPADPGPTEQAGSRNEPPAPRGTATQGTPDGTPSGQHKD